MYKKSISLIIICLYIVCFTGCANLKTKDIAKYVPSLVDEALDLKVGMKLLADSRPAIDKELTADIKDVPQEITTKLIEYFTTSGFLKEIHYPAEKDDDILITGKIHRFMWRSYSKAATYIPIINLYVYLGIPCKTAYGFTHISLELRDNKTGQTVDRFNEYSKVARSYDLYEFKKVDSAKELEESFKEVARNLRRELKSKIISKRQAFKNKPRKNKGEILKDVIER